MSRPFKRNGTPAGDSYQLFGHLGEPDLTVGGLRIWASDEVFIEDLHESEIGGEFVDISVLCEGSRSHSQFQCCLFRYGLTDAIYDLAELCGRFLDGEATEPVLDLYHDENPRIPNLVLNIKPEDGLGHLRVSISVDLYCSAWDEQHHPLEGPQEHKLQFLLDQSYLPKIIEECSALRKKWSNKPSPT